MRSTAEDTQRQAAPPAPLTGALSSLPRGHTLATEELGRRHRALLGLLWLHVAGVLVYGLARGFGLGRCLLDAGILAAIAAGATVARGHRQAGPALVALGLLTAAIEVVAFSHGVARAHPYLLVATLLVALYEEWLPLTLAGAYVVVYYVVHHPGGWGPAAVHVGFLAAALAVAITAWRLDEAVRRETQRAHDRTREAERELERYAAELERSNRDLEQFAAVASHDLREPLRTVAGFVALLESRERFDADAREYVRHAREGAERMQALIDDLLEYARAGRSERVHDAVDLGEVLRATLVSLRGAIEGAAAVVEADTLPVVRGDAKQLEQVLQNLLANAIKFSGSTPPRVRISSRRADGQEWELAVVDNGIGIDPAQAERVFEMFQRLHAGERYDGTGVGLAIVKRIVEGHGGRVWVEPAPGGGSAFRLTLPAADEGVSPAAPARAQPAAPAGARP
jgi:signal transduction histidine kinase